MTDIETNPEREALVAAVKEACAEVAKDFGDNAIRMGKEVVSNDPLLVRQLCEAKHSTAIHIERAIRALDLTSLRTPAQQREAMTDTKAETPITDGNAGIVTNAIGEKLEAVPASIARQLERDLAAAREDALSQFRNCVTEHELRLLAERDASQLRVELAEARKAIRDAADGVREDRFDWYAGWLKQHAEAIALAQRKGERT